METKIIDKSSRPLIAIALAVIVAFGASWSEVKAQTTADYHSPAWSPNGKIIAFGSNRSGAFRLYTIVVATGELERLGKSEKDAGEPAWTPDGQNIIYSGEPGLRSVDVDSGIEGPALTDFRSTSPAVAPAGNRIAFEGRNDGNNDLYLMNADGSGLTRLTHDPANDFAPSWSPDGLRLAFASKRSGRYSIYILTVATGEIAPLIESEDHLVKPVWSPDGTRLLYGSIGAQNCLGVYEFETQKHGCLLQPSQKDFASSWSPDSRQIAYSMDHEEGMAIYVANADGSDARLLVAGFE